MTTTPIAPVRDTAAAVLPAEPVRPHRARAVVAITLLLVLVGSELGARALARRLPAPLEWKQREAALIVEQMKRVAATEGGADVVFVGSSVANFGFEPDVLRARTGLRAYNAALPGSSVLSLEPWVKEMVVPLLKPRVAVIALTSRDVNDAGAPQKENLEQYLTSGERKRMLGAESAAERAERAISGRLALVRLRGYLRRPAAVAKELKGTPALERPIPLGPHGEPRFPEANFAFDETPGRRQWEIDALRGFDQARNVKALRRLVEWLRARGIAPVLVEMPVVEDVYAPYHPRGAGDLAAFRTALSATAATTGVPFIRAASRPRDDFVDSIHLNRRGAAELTAEITAKLRALQLV